MGPIELLAQAGYLVCVYVSVRLWARTRSRQAQWAALTFGILGAILVVSFFLGEDGQLSGPLQRALILAVLLLPWLLFRFADSVVTVTDRTRRVLDVIGVGMASSSLVMPSFPEEGVDPTASQQAWTYAVLGAWLLLAIVTTRLLWRAGRDEPGVTRGRVRMLAVGSLMLGLTVSASALPGSEDTTQTISQLFSLAAAFTFLSGFAPPPFLRQAWRAHDEAALYQASVGLLSATNLGAVTHVLLPGLRALLGAPGIAMIGPDGTVEARDGDPVLPGGDGVVRVDVGPLDLVYSRSPAMPLFGAGEEELISRLGLLASLAVERVQFVEAERRARAEAEEASAALAEANQELEAVNAELEAFVYTTSHDLKNPVIAILGYVEVLQEDYADQLPEDARYYLERMSVNASFMQSLIRDLLELSRVGRMETEPARVGLTGVLDAIANDAAQRHPEVDLELRRGPDLPEVWMNPTRLRQLIENMVENSCRYAGRRDVVVDVEAFVHPGGLRLDVRDNGVGIPPEQSERVFGMFERLDPDSSEGTGMGLAICRRIVESVGGQVVAVPDPDGAHFRIELPPEALPGAAMDDGDGAAESRDPGDPDDPDGPEDPDGPGAPDGSGTHPATEGHSHSRMSA